MRTISFLKVSSLVVIVSLLLALLLYTAASTTATNNPNSKPVFNAYEKVQMHYGEGPEWDFLRLGTKGELGNTIQACTDGQVIDLYMYVHNSTAASQNGDDFKGPGVATNTIVALDMPTAESESNSHTLTASIDSDQTKVIYDDVIISCDNKKIKLVYSGISNFGTPAPVITGMDNFDLRGDLIDDASLGYERVENGQTTSGIVPGCWQYRARINAQVIVQVVEEPEIEIEIEIEVDEPPVVHVQAGPTTNLMVLGIALLSGGLAITARRLFFRRD